MISSNRLKRDYYEVRPGFDSLRYLVTYSFLTWLAKRSSKREFRLFTEITSNIDRHILSEGLFEKGVIDLLRDVIVTADKRELLIDIGANIGNHTVALAGLFKEGAAVEPHPVLYRVLTANVIRNNHAHVTCHNFGLANEDTQATLAEPADNHSIARVKERSKLPPETFGLSSAQFGNEHSVELRSAHAFFAQFGEKLNGAFVKIDVEGMEEEIVTAIAPLLASYRPLVGFEWFTSSQPGLIAIVSNVEDYELWGIRVHDVGKNLFWRAIKMLFVGRSYELMRIDPTKLDEVYPLAFLVPTGAFG